MAQITITKPIAVLVEGGDYYHFLMHSFANTAVFNDVWIYDFGGITDLGAFLQTFVTIRGFETLSSLGIIRDAETNAQAAIAKIQTALTSNGLACPPQPNAIVAGQPKVGYLIMPHDKATGCLEDACLDAAKDSSLKNCASSFLACVGISATNANWNAKVQSRAIIAGSSPGATLGLSAKLNIWDKNHPSLKVIEDFLVLLH